MPFRITGVEVVASYDAMTRKPGDLRPLPSLVSARLADQMTESIKMQDVADEAIQSPPIAGDLTLALFHARERVVKLMNNNFVGAPAFAVDLDNFAVEYRPTSTGGHQTISWVKRVGASGTTEYWETDLDIQGDVIHTYACLAISVRETAGTNTI